MSPQELNGWIVIAGTLINMGRDAAVVIKAIFSQEGRTEAELNAVLLAIKDENNIRRAKAAAVAFGA